MSFGVLIALGLPLGIATYLILTRIARRFFDSDRVVRLVSIPLTLVVLWLYAMLLLSFVIQNHHYLGPDTSADSFATRWFASNHRRADSVRGMTQTQVEDFLGAPNRSAEDHLDYEIGSDSVFVIRFKNGRATQVDKYMRPAAEAYQRYLRDKGVNQQPRRNETQTHP